MSTGRENLDTILRQSAFPAGIDVASNADCSASYSAQPLPPG